MALRFAQYSPGQSWQHLPCAVLEHLWHCVFDADGTRCPLDEPPLESGLACAGGPEWQQALTRHERSAHLHRWRTAMGGAPNAPPNACWDAAEGRVQRHDGGSGDRSGADEAVDPAPRADPNTHLRVKLSGQADTRAALQSVWRGRAYMRVNPWPAAHRTSSQAPPPLPPTPPLGEEPQPDDRFRGDTDGEEEGLQSPPAVGRAIVLYEQLEGDPDRTVLCDKGVGRGAEEHSVLVATSDTCAFEPSAWVEARLRGEPPVGMCTVRASRHMAGYLPAAEAEAVARTAGTMAPVPPPQN